jgi:hypothetical protein
MPSPRFNLTPTEIAKVKRLLQTEGMTPSMIAQRFGYTVRTIEYYRDDRRPRPVARPQLPRSSTHPFDFVATAVTMRVGGRRLACISGAPTHDDSGDA